MPSWNGTMDEQAMAWVTQRPEDWQLGGICDVYVWGSGRHGEFGEVARSSTSPIVSTSLSCAQQVSEILIVLLAIIEKSY